MNQTCCRNLDDYLDSELPDREAQAFEEHARGCSACRAALAESQVLAGLLRHAYRGGSCQLPHADLRPRRSWQLRPRSAAACAAAVAAVLLVWAAATFLMNDEPVQAERRTNVAQGRQSQADEALDANAADAASQMVHVQPADERQMIVRRLPTRNENVTIVWVYPTFGPTN